MQSSIIDSQKSYFHFPFNRVWVTMLFMLFRIVPTKCTAYPRTIYLSFEGGETLMQWNFQTFLDLICWSIFETQSLKKNSFRRQMFYCLDFYPGLHRVKYVYKRIFPRSHFRTFGLNTKVYRIDLRIQYDWKKMRT